MTGRKAALPTRPLGGGTKEDKEQRKEFCISCKIPVKFVLLISSTAPQPFIPIYPLSNETAKFILLVFHSLPDPADILVPTELSPPEIVEKPPIVAQAAFYRVRIYNAD